MPMHRGLPQSSRRRLGQNVLAAGVAGTLTLALLAAFPVAQSSDYTPLVTPANTGCSAEARSEALKAMQAEVVTAAPAQVQSIKNALAPGGALAGWRLSHGLVVLATAGAIVVDNMQAKPPLPQLLIYEPSAQSTPDDWLDFDRPDDPYRLVGWAFMEPYTPGSAPPRRRCIASVEWLVHEAGWHLKDGGMHLTPGAAMEPARPRELAIHMWHPRVWDVHMWRGDEGVPTIAFANPTARRGGKDLPRDAFFYLADGKKRFPAVSTR
jgi:hypothetical protein